MTDTTPDKKGNIKPFLALDTDKRNKIINAALSEFRYGYKKASTDAIVKKAGISKGLIYHYFGSKEGLYVWLMDYALDLCQQEYSDMLAIKSRDILEAIWQSVQNREDMAFTHPHVYDFLNAVEWHADDNPRPELRGLYKKRQQQMTHLLYSQSDTTLFRTDIDPRKAIDIIVCTLENLHSIYTPFDAKNIQDITDTDYQHFLIAVKQYLDVFRKGFYR